MFEHHHLNRLVRLLRSDSSLLGTILIFSAAVGLLSLALPIATQALVNNIAFGNLFQPIAILTAILAAVLVFAGTLQALRVYVVETLQQRIFVRVASETIHRVLRAKADAFRDHHGPELVNRFFDVITLQKAAASLLIDGLTIVMQSVVGLVLLAVYHPWLLAFDLLLLAAILVIVFGLGRGAVKTAIEESKAKYALVAWFEDVARYSITFKSPDAAQLAIERADVLTSEYLFNRKRHFRILFRQVIGSYWLHAAASAGLLGVGGWLVLNRQLTLGQLIAAELIVELVVTGFSKLGKHLESYYDLSAAIDKLGYIEDLPLEPSKEPGMATSDGPAEASLSDVTLRLGSKTILEGARLEARPGWRIGLSGHSGAGKSTLLDLIYGLRRPDSGSVRVDGADLREWSLTQLRREVALVRGTEIFDGTILENVRAGNSSANANDVKWALTQVGLREDIEAMPDGIDTWVSTGGGPLSEGQALRLVFARALLQRPRLLLVDEALDGIADARERETLVESLFEHDRSWTLVVASANRDLLRRCDAVYEIESRQLVKI